MGQRGEPGIKENGMHKARWKNWMVLVSRILRKAQHCETRKSERRGTLGEIMRSDSTTKLDFRKKEKLLLKTKARIAA